MSILSRLKKRINEPPEAFESQAIHAWSSAIPDITPIREIRPRSHVRAAGVVQSIRLARGVSAPTLEVTLFDGTGEVTGVWLGRSRIRGIDLGAQVIISGTTCECRSVSGGAPLQVLNPEYELQPPTLEG